MTTRRVEIGQRSETVRRANLSAIARELHTHGRASRSELVTRTGLTRSAIRGLIGEFVAAGLASEEPSAPVGAPGRPSSLVRLRPERAVALALEIAVDSLAAAVVGVGGDLLCQTRIDRPRDHVSVEAIVGDLVGLASDVGAFGPFRPALLGVGVAVVGVVRRSDGLVSFAPNLGWRNVPLGEVLAGGLREADAGGVGSTGAFRDDVPIAVANEADLGAVAEHRRGAAIGVDNVLFISGEVGVGGGLIVDGHPLTGAAGYGGELGHMPVNPDGKPCRCGSVGCWETEIGAHALLALSGHPASGGATAIDAVLREAADGAPAARAALESVGRWLGYGLAGLVNVFNPQLIVLGGVCGRIHAFVRQAMLAELDRRALPASRALVRVVPAKLGVDAPLVGAAELAFEGLLADPASWLSRRDMFARRATA